MTRETIDAYVKALVRRVLHIRPDAALVEATHLANDLRADELDRAELFVEVEGAFKVDFTDDDYAGILTVGQLIDAVDRALTAKADVP